MKMETPQEATIRKDINAGILIDELVKDFRKRLEHFDQGDSVFHTKLHVGRHNEHLSVNEMRHYWEHELQHQLSPKQFKELKASLPKGGLDIEESVKRYGEILKAKDINGDGRLSVEELRPKLPGSKPLEEINHPLHLPKLNGSQITASL